MLFTFQTPADRDAALVPWESYRGRRWWVMTQFSGGSEPQRGGGDDHDGIYHNDTKIRRWNDTLQRNAALNENWATDCGGVAAAAAGGGEQVRVEQ